MINIIKKKFEFKKKNPKTPNHNAYLVNVNFQWLTTDSTANIYICGSSTIRTMGPWDTCM